MLKIPQLANSTNKQKAPAWPRNACDDLVYSAGIAIRCLSVPNQRPTREATPTPSSHVHKVPANIRGIMPRGCQIVQSRRDRYSPRYTTTLQCGLRKCTCSHFNARYRFETPTLSTYFTSGCGHLALVCARSLTRCPRRLLTSSSSGAACPIDCVTGLRAGRNVHSRFSLALCALKRSL